MQMGERTTVIACTTVIKEMMPHLPPGEYHRVQDLALYVNPDVLRRILQ